MSEDEDSVSLAEPETIAAIATAPGRGAIGVIRISGPAAAAVARRVLDVVPTPRVATYSTFSDATHRPIDSGLALWFPAPHSYTGEDVLELQGHGGPVVLDMLLARVISLGPRLARAGEFSERAFLNGKIDLAQAEAVADLIDASSRAAASAAQRTLSGEFSLQINRLLEGLTHLRMHLEATLDFPDEEDVDGIDPAFIAERLGDLKRIQTDTRAQAAQGTVLRDGLPVAIIGPPNVGKSSLLNRLAGRDRAIVTDIPGTTRDVLEEHIELNGLPIQLVDTAGMRETEDPVERIGIERALAATQTAVVVLQLVDGAAGYQELDAAVASNLPAGLAPLIVYNKIDLRPPGAPLPGGVIGISARTGFGIEALTDAIKAQANFAVTTEGQFSARRRHLEALDACGEAIYRATEVATIGAGLELVAEELRLAQDALGRITGRFTSDDLLGEIFSSFCIGK